uniref:C2H2-type domain-containing protein n=1 Tax=Cyanoptyche gloeocystis TaxID=77922 RepID=A0A7S2NMS3_9EUKA|mmetsp:Transcript_134/g.286  ORF Transcript_134/g.286 Transcript_134/m.286 type:complete len:286 (+) Transcript_134:93-950(+)
MPVSKMKSSITFLLILVVLQFYLSCVNAALYGGAESSTASCNRFRSRIARNVIEEQIFPAADDVEYELPSDCPFARDNDILRLQELSKKEMWRDQWRCTVCSKVFKSEHFLDKHLENKHSSHISKNATVCLADMCDFLNCDNLIRQMHYDEALEDVPIENLGFDPTAPIICKDHVMERKKLACQAVMQRCFPPDNEATKYLNDLFDREFCQRMTCSNQNLASLRQAFSPRLPFRLRKKYYIFAGLLIFSVLIFYSVFWYLRRGISASSGDLRRLRGSFRSKSKRF